MFKYKTAVTDYEGMQGVLDAHSVQGWQLFSVAPDTWRKSVISNSGLEPLPLEDLNMVTAGQANQEYSASYYLLVFQREDDAEVLTRTAAAEEPRPYAQSSRLED